MSINRIAFFDVDHTLIPETSTEALFIRWLIFRGKIRPMNVWRALVFFLKNLSNLQDKAIRQNKFYLRGMKRNEVDEYTKLVAKDLEKKISKDGIEEIKKSKQEGFKVVLLSAGPDFLVSHVQKFVNADDSIATEFEIVNDRFTGLITSLNPYGAKKVTAALKYVQAHNSTLADARAYANANSDLPLLTMVGEPVAVNPSKKLKRVAQAKKWPVYYFKSR